MTLAAIVEMDEERDRKTCVHLDLKVTGANHELAQWLLDHPRYSGRVVGEWLQCGHDRINGLRNWAAGGFNGSPFDRNNKPDKRPRHDVAAPLRQSPLKSNDNSEPNEDDDISEHIAAPAEIEENVLYIIQRINENAKASSKILKASALDREAAERISTAIERMIQKWRSIQSTLAKKG